MTTPSSSSFLPASHLSYKSDAPSTDSTLTAQTLVADSADEYHTAESGAASSPESAHARANAPIPLLSVDILKQISTAQSNTEAKQAKSPSHNRRQSREERISPSKRIFTGGLDTLEGMSRLSRKVRGHRAVVNRTPTSTGSRRPKKKRDERRGKVSGRERILATRKRDRSHRALG